MAKLATRDEVAKWINDSLTPKEWADVKATANNAAAQVAMLNSRQASLENKVQLSLINQQQLTPAFVAANYATKGDIYTLQTQYTDLAYWVTQLRAKIGI